MMTPMFSLILLLVVGVGHGQQIAKKQCENYTNKIDKVAIQNAIPHSARLPRHIVGGKKSTPMEFPFMVALGYDDNGKMRWECGGALISDNFVLTAAHCATHRELGSIKMVRMGTTDLRVALNKKPAQDINVTRVITHPDYAPPSVYHDIALVELDSNVKFSSSVLPACLQIETQLDNVAVTAMGWGRLEFTGDQSSDLMKVVLTLFSIKDCNKSYESETKQKLNRGIDSKIQICAGSPDQTPKDTCQGDSGGPLHIASGTKHIIVGITSFGKACGITNDPGVYTKVAAYVPWVETIVWKRI